jgi:acetyltransferase-like isoleucine patch superfamily enzyme
VYDPDGIPNDLGLEDITLDEALDERADCEYLVGTTWVPGQHPISRRTRNKRLGLIGIMQDHRLVGATVAHPSAQISPRARLGHNVIIGSRAQINHGAVIHDHVTVKDQAYISHDVVVGSRSLIQIGACVTGGCEVGEDCFVGVKSTIVNRHQDGRHMKIGNGTVIAPSVTVFEDLPENSRARPGTSSRVY